MSAPDLAGAARFAESLAENLRRTASDPGWAASALNTLAELDKLRDALAARHGEWLTSQIAEAVGNAVTHDWRVSDGGADIVCRRCECLAMPSSLRSGQTPTCPDRCQEYTELCGHSLFPAYDSDTSHCIYCKTVYPATVEVPVAGQGRKAVGR